MREGRRKGGRDSRSEKGRGEVRVREKVKKGRSKKNKGRRGYKRNGENAVREEDEAVERRTRVECREY